jgi:hypothetical protein
VRDARVVVAVAADERHRPGPQRQSFELNILAERVFAGSLLTPSEGAREAANGVTADK